MIELRDITRVFSCGKNSVHALNGVTLAIPTGKMLAVTGPSGSGKTTLMNIIGCIDRPTGGQYLLDKQDISTCNARQLARLRNETFGFVVQDFALINDYSVYQNIVLPIRYSNTHSERQRKQAVSDLVTRLGISEKLTAYPQELSGGQKQRVAIARALINDAKILLADEPTGALDQKNGQEILQLFREINSSGKTVLIETHDMNIANQCDEIIKIVDGRVL